MFFFLEQFFVLKQYCFRKSLQKQRKNHEKTWKKTRKLDDFFFVGGCFFFSILCLQIREIRPSQLHYGLGRSLSEVCGHIIAVTVTACLIRTYELSDHVFSLKVRINESRK